MRVFTLGRIIICQLSVKTRPNRRKTHKTRETRKLQDNIEELFKQI